MPLPGGVSAQKCRHDGKQQPVIDNVRAGRYPNIFGNEVATEQHNAGRSDNQKTLHEILLISGQMQRSEDKRSTEPGGDNGTLARHGESLVTTPEHCQKRQDGDHLLTEQLRGRF